ncbi:FecR domain-containing protein [Butyricimonas hominis]|uniref:FecR domain-containing protein n=1 Tax=Butyricimonas TaxID=574697 RepID=UPI0035183CDE
MPEYTNEYRIAQLLAKKITGDLSPEEEQELQKWEREHLTATLLHSKIADPVNRHERDELINKLNTNFSWQKVEQRITRKNTTTTSHKLIWWSSSVAAVILLAITIFLYTPPKEAREKAMPIAEVQTGSSKAIFITPDGKQFNLSLQDSSRTLELGAGIRAVTRGRSIEYVGNTYSTVDAGKPNIIQVPRGGEYELILPDGTHVWINSDSKLSFPVHFTSEKREVLLSGEAYFDVAKMKDCPFIVKTQNLAIKVLGTEFNVRAYPDAEVTETTLCRGSVNVSDGKSDITLQPSQQAVYVKANKDLSTRRVDVRLYTTWKNGIFMFENKPLEEIMTTLSRWYNINVFYANPAVKTYHFTGDLERYSNFQKTLNMIEKATSIKFIINGNTVTVKEVKE